MRVCAGGGYWCCCGSGGCAVVDGGVVVDDDDDGRGVQRVEDPINLPESDRPKAQRVDPKSIAGWIRFCL